MTEEWVETTVGRLAEWAEERGEDVDLHGAEILLGLIAGLDLAEPGDVGVPELRAVLLKDLPDQVVAGPEEIGPILATCGAVVDFLAGTGSVDDKRAEELREELARLGPELATALAEAAELDEETAARLVLRMMTDDGVDPSDEAAKRAWLAEFEALPEEEKAERTGPYLAELLSADDQVVPPVRLAGQAELAEAARESRLLTGAVELADWAGERDLEDDALSGADTVVVVAALGLATPRADRELDGAEPEAMDDVPELARLWDAAIAAGLIEAADGRSRPGPLLRSVKDGDREAVLDAWITMLDDALTGAEAHAEHAPGHGHADPEGAELTPTEAVRDALPGVLLALYEQERPTPHADLLGALSDHLLGAYEVSADDAPRWQAAGAEALDLELADLESWGVLESLEGGYVLTPLGVWSVRELLIAAGYTAPVVGDLADLPADALVEGLALHRSEDTADEEIDLWLARRAPAEAAREMVRTMAEGTPGTRTLASAVLDRLDPSALPSVREGLEIRETRPYAALWLREHGEGTVELTPAELTWLFVDTVAGLLETTEPDVAISTALTDHGPDLDLASVIEELWRVDHPEVADVLEALGDHHPDRQLAKAARKAAFKARSRPAGH